MKTGTRISLIAVVSASLALFITLAVYSQRKDSKDGGAETQWEYLVVAGGSANLSTSGNENYSSMRKQPDTSFARENFPLERNFDKLGAKGWELVAVYGLPNEPVYYFKRVKDSK
ncbi:MAG: hypothetical protein JMDDDDMK_00842 [Acidobacteria bacterium]|nr:hypothetical protein [Acidobacteriota bacterium]